MSGVGPPGSIDRDHLMRPDPVSDHYTIGDLGERIFAALAASGADVDHMTIDDLAPVDGFHIRGREATKELVELTRIVAADHVLDAGCGIGGTSRYLAHAAGCRVTGVDLTGEYVDVARLLSERVGLGERVSFRQGNVLELPFDDAAFDVVWTEHVQMNIADKAGFYGELFRVLRPGGRLAFHDIFAGPEGEEYLPVPWAEEASISHLVPIEELRSLLGAAGFSQLVWEDKTAASSEFFVKRFAGEQEDGASAIGLHVLMNNPEIKFRNLLRNLKDGRICVAQAVMAKPLDG